MCSPTIGATVIFIQKFLKIVNIYGEEVLDHASICTNDYGLGPF
jgi:hypothetical protein